MSIKASGSSVDKGESLKDTAITLGAYDPDVIVIRHPQIGAPQLVARVTEARDRQRGRRQAPAPDAGAARPVHDPGAVRPHRGPARGDRRRRPPLAGRALEHPGARRCSGARVTLVGPPPLLPRGIEEMGCEATTDIDAIGAADIVYVLRMQKERMLEGANYVPSLREYTARWGVTPERLRPGQKVMHPGPMNRGVEIDPLVADAADALIETAGARGLVVRMAVLYDLLTTGPEAGRGRSPDGGGVMLFVKDAPKENLIVRGARVLDPVEGLDAQVDVEVDDGVIAELGSNLAAELAQGDRRHRPRARAGVRRPARPPPHPRPRGRGDDRDGHAGRGRAGGYCAILAMPNTEPVVDSAAVLGRARRAGTRRGRGAGRLPGRDLEGPGRAPS